jgi:nucleolar protein 58
VGSASTKLKGKISRSLAAKCALCVRIDALGENNDGKVGENAKTLLEARIKQMEKGTVFVPREKGQGKKIEKYDSSQNKTIGQYNEASDVQLNTNVLKKKKKPQQSIDEVEEEVKEVPKKKKKNIDADN